MINPEDYYARIDKIKDEDFRQDIYLVMLEKAENYKGTPKEFERYLNVIIRNKKIDNFNNKKENPTLSMDEKNKEGTLYSDLVLDTTNLQSQIEAADTLQVMKQNTDNRTFKILELFFESGYTAEEIIDKYPELDIKNPREVYNLVARLRAGDLAQKKPEVKNTVYQLIEDNYSELMKLAYVADIIPKAVISNQFIYYDLLQLSNDLSTMDKYKELAKNHNMSVPHVRLIISKLNTKI